MKRLSLKLLPILPVLILLFTTSCVNMEYQELETYFETEYKTETYEETEEIVIPVSGANELEPVIQGCGSTSFLGGIIELSRYSCYVPTQHKINQIKISYYAPFEIEVEVRDASSLGSTAAAYDAWSESKHFKSGGALILSDANLGGQIHTLTFDASNMKIFEIIFIAQGAYTCYSIDGLIELSVKELWTDEETKQKVVTKERQVPFQVEKQRLITKTKKVPIWELIFGKD